MKPIQVVLMDKPATTIEIIGAIAGIAALLSFMLYVFFENKANRRIAAEKAVDMSRFFSEDIMKYMGIIVTIYENCDDHTKALFSNFGIDNMINFTYQELQDIFPETEINQLKTATDSIDINTIKCIYLHHGMDHEIISKRADDFCVLRKISDKETYEKTFFYNDIFTIKRKCLNYLEYMCIAFSSRVANDRIVYQSLHQMFLR